MSFLNRDYVRLLAAMIGKRPVAMNMKVRGNLIVPPNSVGALARGITIDREHK